MLLSGFLPNPELETSVLSVRFVMSGGCDYLLITEVIFVSVRSLSTMWMVYMVPTGLGSAARLMTESSLIFFSFFLSNTHRQSFSLISLTSILNSFTLTHLSHVHSICILSISLSGAKFVCFTRVLFYSISLSLQYQGFQRARRR